MYVKEIKGEEKKSMKETNKLNDKVGKMRDELEKLK